MEKHLKQARKQEREPRCPSGSTEALETNLARASPAPSPETPEAGPGQGCCWESGWAGNGDCRGGGGAAGVGRDVVPCHGRAGTSVGYGSRFRELSGSR